MTETLPPQVHTAIKKALKKFPEGKNQAAIKSALMSAQDYYGWLPNNVLDAVAQALSVPKIQVYEVATFYTLFYTHEVGKNVLSLCTNVSCSLRGAQEILLQAREKLKIPQGQHTSPDKQWSVFEVECLAACSQAPAAQLNGRYCGPLDEHVLQNLLENPEKFL